MSHLAGKGNVPVALDWPDDCAAATWPAPAVLAFSFRLSSSATASLWARLMSDNWVVKPAQHAIVAAELKLVELY